MTALYGVLGDPIAHSLSPLIHNGWMREDGYDASYLAMQVAKGEFSEALSTLAKRGAKGLNITLPHKQAALALADEMSEDASVIGAANTLVRLQSGGWRAENTDAPGFLEMLEAGNIGPSGKRVCIIGAGGAARAVIYALGKSGAQMTVCNRTLSRAEDLLTAYAGEGHESLPLTALETAIDGADMVVNTASLGHSGARVELPSGKDRAFIDISYGQAAGPVLEAARQVGWRTMDGLGMLVAQAALSYQHWFGTLPDRQQALARCRKAVEATS